jgi:hypothetical protein
MQDAAVAGERTLLAKHGSARPRTPGALRRAGLPPIRNRYAAFFAASCRST